MVLVSDYLVGLFLLFVLKIPWVTPSIYSGRQEICQIEQCDCIDDHAICNCTDSPIFSESFIFYDKENKIRRLSIENCSKLSLPPEAIQSQSHLTSFHISNVNQVEFQLESVAVMRLLFLTVTNSTLLTFNQNSFKTFNSDSPTLSVVATDIQTLNIKPKAFASIKSFSAISVNDLNLDQQAFKLGVATPEPLISLSFVNVTCPALAIKVFSSPFQTISFEKSRIGKIQTNAFSGVEMDNITFDEVTINRMDSRAFSDNSIIGDLNFNKCNISKISQNAVLAGISRFWLQNSEIQSMSKFGAINVTVAEVHLINNTFRTLSEESFSFVEWDLVIIHQNVIEFLEPGAIKSFHKPKMEPAKASFSFTDNTIWSTNRESLTNRIPSEASIRFSGNIFHKPCDCEIDSWTRHITGATSESSPYSDLTPLVTNSSQCRLSPTDRPCFETKTTLMRQYSLVFCEYGADTPACAVQNDEVVQPPQKEDRDTFYDQFVLLFQVRTTKGILLFLLFCVLSCVSVVTICVGSIWVHRLYKRARLVRDNLSGSFHFNSGENDRQVLYGSDQTTLPEDEPQYAEISDIQAQIADVHEPPQPPVLHSIHSVTTLPATSNHRIDPLDQSSHYHPDSTTETTSLLSRDLTPAKKMSYSQDISQSRELSQMSSPRKPPKEEEKESPGKMRKSMTETSLTDEIMNALRDKLNDPNLYMTVMDSVASTEYKPPPLEEGVYCAPLYSDPLSPTE